MVNEQYPLLNHQPALMRAFKATLERGVDHRAACGQMHHDASIHANVDQETVTSGCRRASSRCCLALLLDPSSWHVLTPVHSGPFFKEIFSISTSSTGCSTRLLTLQGISSTESNQIANCWLMTGRRGPRPADDSEGWTPSQSPVSSLSVCFRWCRSSNGACLSVVSRCRKPSARQLGSFQHLPGP